jgi:hypothetical protein
LKSNNEEKIKEFQKLYKKDCKKLLSSMWKTAEKLYSEKVFDSNKKDCFLNSGKNII